MLIAEQEALNWEDEDSEKPPIEDDEALRLLYQERSGLPEKKVNVVISRILRGATFKEIAKEQGYTQASHAARAFNDAIKALKKKRMPNDQEG